MDILIFLVLLYLLLPTAYAGITAAPFVPTFSDDIDRIIKLANPKKGNTFLELGCGSGRVMIAMALACRPDLLIADEPSTALDVTVQAQILDLLRNLQKEYGMAFLLITHDLGVIAEMADDVVVMYAGKVVEKTDVKSLYKERKHPYTQGLFTSIPDINSTRKRLEIIEGVVPNPLEFPLGCRFSTRCKYVLDHCHKDDPALREIQAKHFAACHAIQE